MQSLPNELLLYIADKLDNAFEASILLRINRRFYALLHDHLYVQDAMRWGSSALLWATQHGNIQVATKSLGAGAEVNARERPCSSSNDAERRTLRCSLNSQCDHRGNTPLLLAIEYGHQDIVQLLVEMGGDVQLANDCGYHPLQAAARMGDISILDTLLKIENINPELRGYDMQTALMAAVWKGHLDAVKLLLAHPGVDARTGNWGAKTPVFWAAWTGHSEIMKLLLDAGANPNRVYDEFPLQIAAGRGHAGVVRHLLAAGGIPENGTDSEFLCRAAKDEHLGVFKIFLERAIDVNTHEGDGKTALWWASRHNQEQMVSLLLAVDRVDVNASSRDNLGPEFYNLSDSIKPVGFGFGITPLIIAAELGHFRIVRMLAEANRTDLKAQDIRGRTARTAALSNGHYDMAEYLSEMSTTKDLKSGT